MNPSKINNITYKTVSVTFCLFLLLGGWGMFDNHSYNKAYIGIVAAVIIAVCIFQTASVKWWLIVFGALVLAMFLVGFLSHLGYS